ncbi:MAG TPA: hypothetical protein VKF36_07235 [Syntrophorhabdales bacterium]|nr:hypothetical protein [Syntrophorhabdales bacterium]
MKRFMWLATVSFVLLVTFGTLVQAEPKEVTEAVTATFYATAKMLPLDEGGVRVNNDVIGIVLSDTGSGLFHQATARKLGGFTIEKGTYNDVQAWGVYNLQNGDKVFFTQAGTGEAKGGGRGGGKGIITLTGGTGTCAGIKGSETYTWQGLRPAAEGIAQFYMKGTIKYTLP